MNSLPAGNFALSIAHPGHELLLHGFLEQAKPFVFILTDGSYATGKDMMMDSIRVIDTAIKQDKKLKINFKDDLWKRSLMIIQQDRDPEQKHIKDEQIYSEILNQNTNFFRYYADFIATTLIKRNIDYVICDPSEQENAIHEMCNIMTDIAVDFIKKRTGKNIQQFYYELEKPYSKNPGPECVHISLDENAAERKLNSILKYPFALSQLKRYFPISKELSQQISSTENGKEELKQILKELNPNFFIHEYLFPYNAAVLNTDKKPLSEIYIERKAEENISHTITYMNHIKPLKEKIQLIFDSI